MASDYLKLYEDYLREEKHASENTLSSYLRDLRQFSEHLAAQRVTVAADFPLPPIHAT